MAEKTRFLAQKGRFEVILKLWRPHGEDRGVQQVQKCQGALHHVYKRCTQIFVRIRRRDNTRRDTQRDTRRDARRETRNLGTLSS